MSHGDTGNLAWPPPYVMDGSLKRAFQSVLGVGYPPTDYTTFKLGKELLTQLQDRELQPNPDLHFLDMARHVVKGLLDTAKGYKPGSLRESAYLDLRDEMPDAIKALLPPEHKLGVAAMDCAGWQPDLACRAVVGWAIERSLEIE